MFPASLAVLLTTAVSSVALSHDQPLSSSSSSVEAAPSASFPARIRPPSSSSAAVVGSSDPSMQLVLVGVGALRMSSAQSAAIAMYRPSPAAERNQPTVLLVRLSGPTTPQQLQQAVRAMLSPAVQAATGTQWDNITSCTQLDTALASLYLPPASHLTSSSSHIVLPSGTTVSLELSEGRGMLRVWLNERLAGSIESRMLSHATLAALAPLCTLQSQSAAKGWEDQDSRLHGHPC